MYICIYPWHLGSMLCPANHLKTIIGFIVCLQFVHFASPETSIQVE